MAYPTRDRDPLLDPATQEALERRGREALGLLLVILAVMAGAMLGSHTPEDASFFAATDAPVQNWLGRVGAGMAALTVMIVGQGGWTVALVLLIWGLRLILNRGIDRALARLVFLPIALALVAVAAAGLGGPEAGAYRSGAGGLFGDTALGALVNILAVQGPGGVRLLSAGLGAAALAMVLYVGGFTLVELWQLWRGAVRTMRLFLARQGARLVPMLGALALRISTGRSREPVALAPLALPADPDDGPVLAQGGPAAPRAGRFWPRFRLGGLVARTAAPIRRPQTAPIAQLARVEPPLRRTARARAGGAVSEPVPAAPMLRLAPEEDPSDLLVREAEEAPTREEALRAVVHQPLRRAPPPPAARVEAAAETYDAPPLTLLTDPAGIVRHELPAEALRENARDLERVLEEYGVKGEIVSVRPGPVVTMYELEPAPGLKASRVIGLSDDIARSMSALSARVSTVPGRSIIGIELPNARREKVVLREILAAPEFNEAGATLALALGKDIGGRPVVANLARMPHLLIAGTTGSGKSVGINTMILSLLYRLSPEECRMIMIDPKMLELSVYDDIPHLLSPVVTDPKKAVVALKWVVAEMEDRYRKMSRMGVRNIEGYNGRVKDALARGEMFSRTVQTGFDEETGDPVWETQEFPPETLPFIVVVVDEMADLMMVAGKEIEACIQRLAQMARASGIHLIMATQRPSVDVITGTIKANFPTRISFQVTSKIDSRTILGEQGAEQLLGMGDMLYMAGGGRIIRVHGPFVSDEEVEEVVTHLKSLGAPAYVGSVVAGPDDGAGETGIDEVLGLGGTPDSDSALYDAAVAIVARDRKCSTSYIQRKLAIGYNKAARLVEQMETEGVVSPANHVGKREVLIPEP